MHLKQVFLHKLLWQTGCLQEAHVNAPAVLVRHRLHSCAANPSFDSINPLKNSLNGVSVCGILLMISFVCSWFTKPYWKSKVSTLLLYDISFFFTIYKTYSNRFFAASWFWILFCT